MYFNIDKPFKDWLSSIEYDVNKDEKIEEWFKTLKKIVMEEVNQICADLTSEYFLIQEIKVNNKKQNKNIALALNDLMIKLNKL